MPQARVPRCVWGFSVCPGECLGLAQDHSPSPLFVLREKGTVLAQMPEQDSPVSDEAEAASLRAGLALGRQPVVSLGIVDRVRKGFILGLALSEDDATLLAGDTAPLHPAKLGLP